MAIANSYFNSSPITDSDIFVGTKYATNRTVNYTAQSIADYLNVNARISISGQLTFKFTILPNVAKTIAFENGGGDGRLFSSIDKLIVSILDAGGSNITVFLDYLIDSEILLAEQNQPNAFGHYKVTNYVVTANPNFYELSLEYIGGNGNIYKDVYYDMTPWASSGGIVTIPNLQQVTDEGAITTNPIIVSNTSGFSYFQAISGGNSLTFQIDDVFGSYIEMNDPVVNRYGYISSVGISFSEFSLFDAVLTGEYLQITNLSMKPYLYLGGSDGALTGYANIKTDLLDNIYTQQLPPKDGTFAMLDDIPTLTAGTNITIDNTNPLNLIISASGPGATPTLQQVTDEGAITTNAISVQNFVSTVNINPGSIELTDPISYSAVYAGFLTLTNPILNNVTNLYINSLEFIENGIGKYLRIGDTSLGQAFYNLPNKDYNTGIPYVLATLDDIPTTTSQLTNDGADGVNPFITAADIPAAGVTSVGLTMPSAFTVTNSPITSSGDIAVTGAGLVSQYVRGDGTLANFPNSTGGGSSVNYYLNGSVSQGTFGGDTYYQMSKTPILGAGTNFTRTNGAGNGYIASFITDVADPSQLNIPGGNWNVEFYFNASSGGGSPSFYAELYKVSVTNVFTLIASDSANPEGITNGTTVDQYFTSIPVPQTTLLATDRLAIRIFVNTGGRTITLHTENGNLSEVLTTFTTGLTALNGLTTQVQNFAVGTTGTDFAISSAAETHTFNLPTASATNRGALSTTDWTTFNNKQDNVWDFYTKRGVVEFYDFIGGSLGSQVETWGLSTRTTNGDASIVSAATFPNRTRQQGVIAMNTNTNPASNMLLRIGEFNNNGGGFAFGNGVVIFETYICINTLSTGTDRFVSLFGMSVNITYNTNSCLFFIYDEGGTQTNLGAASPNFRISSFNGTTRINTTTAVPIVAQQWYKLKIVVNANNTQVEYFIDNVSVATHTITSINLVPRIAHAKTIGTSNRTLYVDYIGAYQRFTNER
jgi:hypothetical protein